MLELELQVLSVKRVSNAFEESPILNHLFNLDITVHGVYIMLKMAFRVRISIIGLFMKHISIMHLRNLQFGTTYSTSDVLETILNPSDILESLFTVCRQC